MSPFLRLFRPGPGRLRHPWLRWRIFFRGFGRETLGIPPQPRHSLVWDIRAGAFTGLYMGMTFPFLVKIARDQLHALPFAIALMAAAPFIGNLFSPLWAQRMEGKDKLPFCVGSWVLGRLLLFLMPLLSLPVFARESASGTPDPLAGNLFVALIIGIQLIGTVAMPAYTSLMRDIYPDNARGRLMGYVRVVAQSCVFLATLVTGRLLDAGVSFRWLFPIAGVFGLLAGWAFSKVRPLPHIAREAPPAPTRSTPLAFLQETLAILKHNKPYRYFALSVFVYGFANLAVQPLFQLYQVDVFKITGEQIANITNAAALASIGGSFFWGRFMDRFGPPTTVMVSICLVALIPLVYVFAPSVEVLYLAGALSGFGFAGIELSYLASILQYAEPGRTAQYQSLHSLLVGVRGVIASLIGVKLMQWFGYQAVFTVAFFVMLVGSALQWLAIKAAVGSRK